MHLNAPGWNVTGATAPWLPGVAIGHNDRIAWNMTDVDIDTQDVYVEKVNPANPHQVEDDRGQWVDTRVLHDTIVVLGRAEPFAFDREFTAHGVIVATDSKEHLAFTVRWSGMEPGAAGELGALALDRAGSWTEFRAALGRWKMPARRVSYADVNGAAGFQVAALVPVRRPGRGRSTGGRMERVERVAWMADARRSATRVPRRPRARLRQTWPAMVVRAEPRRPSSSRIRSVSRRCRDSDSTLDRSRRRRRASLRSTRCSIRLIGIDRA